MKKIEGTVVVLQDDVDTDQILPGYAMAEPLNELGKFAMAGLPNQKKREQIGSGTVIVAGRNFGCGSSREQAPLALKQAGVRLIIAEGFARIFRRNAINIGLPVVKANFKVIAHDGQKIEADLDRGEICWENEKESSRFKMEPLSENILKTLECGGLIPRVREQLGICRKEEE